MAAACGRFHGEFLPECFVEHRVVGAVGEVSDNESARGGRNGCNSSKGLEYFYTLVGTAIKAA